MKEMRVNHLAHLAVPLLNDIIMSRSAKVQSLHHLAWARSSLYSKVTLKERVPYPPHLLFPWSYSLSFIILLFLLCALSWFLSFACPWSFLCLLSHSDPSLLCSCFYQGQGQSAAHTQPTTFSLCSRLSDASDCSLSHIYNKEPTVPQSNHVISSYSRYTGDQDSNKNVVSEGNKAWEVSAGRT